MKRVCWGLGSILLLSGVALLSPAVGWASGVSQAREVAPPPGDRGELLFELPVGPAMGQGAMPRAPSAGASRPVGALKPQGLERKVGVSPVRPSGAASAPARETPKAAVVSRSIARDERSRTAAKSVVSGERPARSRVGEAKAKETQATGAAGQALGAALGHRSRQADVTKPVNQRGVRSPSKPDGLTSQPQTRAKKLERSPAKVSAKPTVKTAAKLTTKPTAKPTPKSRQSSSRMPKAAAREGRASEKGPAKRNIQPTPSPSTRSGPGTQKEARQPGRAAPRSSARSAHSARASKGPSRKIPSAEPTARARSLKPPARSVSAAPDAPRRATPDRRVPRETHPRAAPKPPEQKGAKKAVRQPSR